MPPPNPGVWEPRCLIPRCSQKQDPEYTGRCTCLGLVPHVHNCIPPPSSDLPRPQTHILPRVSRLPCTASFTLHREDGEWL